MSGHLASWEILAAQRDEVAEELQDIAEEKAEQNKTRNKRRKRRRWLQRTLGVPKRRRARFGSGAPRTIGPKRRGELDLLAREALLAELFACKGEIDQIGIERVLLDLWTRWSVPFQVASSEEEKAVDRLAKDAIRGWLVQFVTKETRGVGSRQALSWQEEVVRADLKVQQRLAKAVLRALPKKPTKWPELRACDFARAECEVIERFLYSRHLSSPKSFRHAAGIIRVGAVAPMTAYTPKYYVQCWRFAVDKLIKDLCARYAGKVE